MTCYTSESIKLPSVSVIYFIFLIVHLASLRLVLHIQTIPLLRGIANARVSVRPLLFGGFAAH